MKDKRKIKKVAKEIVKLEKQCMLNQHSAKINNYMQKMYELTENLSLEELLAVDEYISKKKMLKR